MTMSTQVPILDLSDLGLDAVRTDAVADRLEQLPVASALAATAQAGGRGGCGCGGGIGGNSPCRCTRAR